MSKNEKPVFHGSDVEKIAEKYGLNKDEIISFSANVNPLGISPALKEKLKELEAEKEKVLAEKN